MARVTRVIRRVPNLSKDRPNSSPPRPSPIPTSGPTSPAIAWPCMPR